MNLFHSPVEAVEHDGVLGAEVVGGERVGGPLDALVRVGEELGARHVGAQRDARRVQELLPRGEQGLPAVDERGYELYVAHCSHVGGQEHMTPAQRGKGVSHLRQKEEKLRGIGKEKVGRGKIILKI